MFELLDQHRKGSPLFISQLLNYCQEGNTDNLERVKMYYRRATNYINPENVLAIALDLFDESVLGTTDILSLYFGAKEQVSRIERQLRFTSDTNTGKRLEHGWFYGTKNEHVLSVRLEDSLKQIVGYVKGDKKWEDFVPVKVVKHPFVDFAYNIPTSVEYVKCKKTYTSHAIDINTPIIVHVDLALLFVMYRLWRMSGYSHQQGSYRTTANFIGEFVMPNMLASHINVVYWNRLLLKVLGEDDDLPNIPPVGNHGVTVGHLAWSKTYLNDSLEQLISKLKNNKGEWVSFVNTLPTLEKGTMLIDLLKPQGELRRQQSYVLYLLPLLDLIYTVLAIGKTILSIRNKIAPTWDRQVRIWKNTGLLNTHGSYVEQYALERIEQITTLLSS